MDNRNPRLNNNIINRHRPINQEYMMNNQNNNNNMINMNNNLKNTNARIGLNLNLNKNNNININMNPNNMNNINRNINPKNNVNYMNRNVYPNNNTNLNPDNVIMRAMNMIRIEFKKKDDKIRALGLKVAELEKKIDLITKNNAISNNYYNNELNVNEGNKILNNNYVSNINNNDAPKKMGKNFTFSEKYSGELNQNDQNENYQLANNYKRINKMQDMNYNMDNNINNNYLMNKEVNNNRVYNYQSNSNNQYQINDKKIMAQPKYIENNNNDLQRENSIKTWNSGNYNGWTKQDVKLYLKEVKAKLETEDFKEFIRSIKLLTSSKGEGNIDRRSVVEKVMNLLGEHNYDLFVKFKNIIGYNE